MTMRRAACSCGQLHLTIEGQPSRISMCHCLECQRRTGVTPRRVWIGQSLLQRRATTIQIAGKPYSTSNGVRAGGHCGGKEWPRNGCECSKDPGSEVRLAP
jgi:hypothetical protein